MEAALLGVGPRVLCARQRRLLPSAGSRSRALLGKEAHVARGADGPAPCEPEELACVRCENARLRRASRWSSNETSTGVVHAARRPGARRCGAPPARSSSSTSSATSPARRSTSTTNGIDFALAGSQKALALPPGITVVCASRALPRRRAREEARQLLPRSRARSSTATPSARRPRRRRSRSTTRLARQLEDISAGRTLPERAAARRGADAWRARFESHRRMRARRSPGPRATASSRCPRPRDRLPHRLAASRPERRSTSKPSSTGLKEQRPPDLQRLRRAQGQDLPHRPHGRPHRGRPRRPARRGGRGAGAGSGLGNRESESEPADEQQLTAASAEVSADSSQRTAQRRAAACSSMRIVEGYSELAAIVDAWPHLRAPVRAVILGIVQAFFEQTKRSGRPRGKDEVDSRP